MGTVDFASRIVGLFVFTFIGSSLGVEAAEPLGLPPDVTSLIFGLVGALFGLVLTPWISVRPIQMVNQAITELPAETFLITLFGGFIGLLLAFLSAYPLSLLPTPFNRVVPAVVSIAAFYIGVTIFRLRAHELWEVIGGQRRQSMGAQADRQLLLDTSVLIDGRVVDIAKAGFLGGTLLIPRFVMSELHQVADSSDPLRRNRGRRGLIKVNELQRNNMTPVKIIDDDFDEIAEVDDKLVALAVQLDAGLMTNDYPLSKVAESQNVNILNVNILANAVRSVYIPGETFPLHVIQEGTDYGQGVGYLKDGTMVVVENGKKYMDRSIEVEVTKLINSPAGRMIFAVPESEAKQNASS